MAAHEPSKLMERVRIPSPALHHGEWRSLVAHPAGGRAVAGSNPVSPTKAHKCAAVQKPAPERAFRFLDRGHSVAMAVTQQLARLSREHLARCRESVEALDELCSFNALPSEDHLDLDWAPRPLKLAATLTGDELVAAVREACSGGDEINAAYREFPAAVFEHPVRALGPDAVAAVAATLATSDGSTLVGKLPRGPAAAGDVVDLRDFDDHRGAYLREHFDLLRRFYEEAASRGCAVATWWD